MVYKATYMQTDLSAPLVALVRAQDDRAAASMFESRMKNWHWYTIDPAAPDDAEPGTYLIRKHDCMLCTEWNMKEIRDEIMEGLK